MLEVGCAGLSALLILGCDPNGGPRESGGAGIDTITGADEADDTEGEGEGAPGDGAGADTSDEPSADTADDAPEPEAEDTSPEIPFDAGKLAEVCARNNGDRVAEALCGGAQLQSIGELRAALNFSMPFFALTANSTSLVARDVSAVNPRLIVGDALFPFEGEFDAGLPGEALAMGFVRGEQFVELMGFDPVANELNFYLLMFEQACNDKPGGCTTADLVTPAVETDWTRWTLYQDKDLANTTLDCAVCHQPLGPGTPKIPRVQEIGNSWTHWFPVRPPEAGGVWSSGGDVTHGILPDDPGTHGTRSSEVLWSTFVRTHAGDEAYGGVTIEELRDATAGPNLETFVRTFVTMRQLPADLQPSQEPQQAASDYYCDSASMELQGEGSSWQAEFGRVLAGQRLPLPSHRIDITDAAKREAAIDAYIAVATRAAPASTIIDPADVISEEALTEMSALPRPDASALEIVQHMCSRCHNSKLDPELSRARFDAAALADLTPAQKATIADRITRGHDDKLLMPPNRFATLPDWAVDRVLTWLES